MPWDGNGNFLRNFSWTADALAGIKIIATRMDADTNDITTNGLGDCLTRDGQGSAVNDLPMNNFRHTGVGDADARDEYGVVGQIQDNEYVFVIGAGTGDAITATFTPTITALVDGMQVCVRAPAANTVTIPTFKADATVARRITKNGNQALVAGDYVANMEMLLRYNLANLRWELLNPVNTTGIAQTPWAVAAGTANAITATYTPANAALTDGLLLGFRATAANTTTTPTFAPDGLTAHTITKKGGTALVAGDIPAALAECLVRYNLANTRWELLNPVNLATPVILATGNLDTGTAIAKSLDLSAYSAYSRIDVEIQDLTATATGGSDFGILFSTDAVSYITTNTYSYSTNLAAATATAQAQIKTNTGIVTTGTFWMQCSFYNLNVAKPCRVMLHAFTNDSAAAAPGETTVVGVQTTSAIIAVQFLFYNGTTPVVTGGTYRIVGYV